MGGIFSLYIKDQASEEFINCYKILADMSYEGYLFIAGNSGRTINNFHYIKSIKTSNPEKQVDEDTYNQE